MKPSAWKRTTNSKFLDFDVEEQWEDFADA